MVLYINACVRSESRTEIIAKALLEKLGEYQEVTLKNENLKPLDEERLNKRTNLIALGKFDDDMFSYAEKFANADTIVISAPLWDGSFPAILKTYLENIYVMGIVSKFSNEGIPIGLCKAKKLYYVSTSGGKYAPEYSYNYIRDLVTNIFGIKETELLFAENLDIIGNNPEKIVADAIKLYGL